MPSYKIALVLACLAFERQGVRIATQTGQGLEKKQFKTEQGSQSHAEAQRSSEQAEPKPQKSSQRWLGMLTALLAAPNLAAGFGVSGWNPDLALRSPALAPHGRGATARLAVGDQDGARPAPQVGDQDEDGWKMVPPPQWKTTPEAQGENPSRLPGSQPGKDWTEELKAVQKLTKELKEAGADGKDSTKEVRAVQDLTKELLEANAEELEEFCFGLPGAMAPLGQWDPAGLLDGRAKSDVYLWRESELTHGRLAMLASAGFLTQAAFHPGGENLPVLEQIKGLSGLSLFTILFTGFCEGARSQRWTGIQGMLRTIPKAEGEGRYLGYKPGDIGYYPGDLVFDPLGLKPTDPAELRSMQEKELANGRLAMLAAAGFAAQEAVTGKTWAS